MFAMNGDARISYQSGYDSIWKGYYCYLIREKNHHVFCFRIDQREDILVTIGQ